LQKASLDYLGLRLVNKLFFGDCLLCDSWYYKWIL